MFLMLKNSWRIFWNISVMTSVGRKQSYLEVLTRSIISVTHGSLNLLTDKNKYESSQQHHWPPTLKHQLSSLHNSLYTNDLTGPSVKYIRFRIFLFIHLPYTINLFNHLSKFPFSRTGEYEELKIFTSFEQNMDFVKLRNFYPLRVVVILLYPISESVGNTSYDKLSATLQTCLVLYQLY